MTYLEITFPAFLYLHVEKYLPALCHIIYGSTTEGSFTPITSLYFSFCLITFCSRGFSIKYVRLNNPNI